jgi:adenine deaminase
MKVKNMLAALSALVVCPPGVSVASDPDVYESLPLPYGDLLSASDRAQMSAQSGEMDEHA